MRKSLFFSVFVIVSIITAFSFTGRDHFSDSVREKPISCSLSCTFYNNSTTYTLPLVAFADGSGLPGSDIFHTNIAPSSTDVITILYTSGSLEFNIQFTSPHPGGKVTVYEDGNAVTCQNVARNSNVVTLQFDNSPNCTSTYEVKFDPNVSC
jgi:hypothetical protein